MAFPQILGTTKGTDSSDLTTHTATYPSGILNGELIIIAIVSNGTPTISSPSGWRGLSQASGGMTSRICYRYANGHDETGDFTFTTSASEKCSWIVLRCDKKSIINHHHFSTGTATTSVTNARFRSSNVSKDYTLLSFIGANLDALPSGASTNYTLVDSQAGNNTDGASMYIQKRELNSTANTEDTPSSQTLSVSSDYVSRMISLTFVKTTNKLLKKWWDHGNTGADLSSTEPLKGAGQAFIGDGSRIERIGVNMRRSSTVTGTMQLKLYALTGTYGASGTCTPTGSALATADITIDPSNFSTTVWQYEEFVFNAPFRTEYNKAYFFTIEVSDISGGNIRIARAGSTTGDGNAATSGDLSTWSAAAPNDLVHFVQVLENDAPYIFKGDFGGRASMPDNNTLRGWEVLDQIDMMEGMNLPSGTASYVTQEITTEDGKTVFHGRAIDDDIGTGTAERAQIGIYVHPQTEQPQTFHIRTRMKFHADLEYLRANRTNGIGVGYSDWIDMWEVWLQLDDTLDGDTAGSARWNINLHRASGSNQPFTWYLKGEFMQPEAMHYVDMWNAANSSIPVQCNVWFNLDIFMKVGEGTDGRFVVKIKYDGEEEQTLFDVNDTTLYYEGRPQLKPYAFDPVKVYTSDAIMDWMATNSKQFSMYYEEILWLNPNRPAPAKNRSVG